MLDANSTLDDARTEYLATAGYDVAGSVDQARRHCVALRHLLLHLPAATAQGGESITLSIQTYEAQLRKVEQWLGVNDASSTLRVPGYVRHVSFQGFRR